MNPRSQLPVSSASSTLPKRSAHSASRVTRAVPERTAETTNRGAMSDVFHQLRAIWRPKIQAVTEWSRIAVGSPT